MRRREFITLAGSATVAWPLAGRGQPTATPVITVINARKAEAATASPASFAKA